MVMPPVPGKVPIANPPRLPVAPLDAAAWAGLVGRRLVIDVPASTANLGPGTTAWASRSTCATRCRSRRSTATAA